MKNDIVRAHLENKKINIYLSTDFDYLLTSHGIHELNDNFDSLVIKDSRDRPIFINPDKIYFFEIC